MAREVRQIGKPDQIDIWGRVWLWGGILLIGVLVLFVSQILGIELLILVLVVCVLIYTFGAYLFYRKFLQMKK